MLTHLYDEETVSGQRDAEVVAGRAVGKELAAIGGKHGYSLGSGVHNAQGAVLLTSSLIKYVFYNWLINNILYLCVT